ncbi:hypothetical protein VIGAN_01176200 [Vigna angularis var. angularis]|uniref:Retrotransposon gag domain-containing protein n=1 Tax=Vigna angularis var. angularis TaxID=157739 RepID=A0A0S3R0K6_PHAAN|nr:hypothetical protein VIGAN_01176200 [Vigna angularis var. angularis]
MKRVEFPTFEGTNPMGWIARVERFFNIQNISEREKIKLAYISMERGASYWFRFWKKKTKNPSWTTLTEALQRRFDGRNRGSIFEKLATVR